MGTHGDGEIYQVLMVLKAEGRPVQFFVPQLVRFLFSAAYRYTEGAPEIHAQSDAGCAAHRVSITPLLNTPLRAIHGKPLFLQLRLPDYKAASAMSHVTLLPCCMCDSNLIWPACLMPASSLRVGTALEVLPSYN